MKQSSLVVGRVGDRGGGNEGTLLEHAQAGLGVQLVLHRGAGEERIVEELIVVGVCVR